MSEDNAHIGVPAEIVVFHMKCTGCSTYGKTIEIKSLEAKFFNAPDTMREAFLVQVKNVRDIT